MKSNKKINSLFHLTWSEILVSINYQYSFNKLNSNELQNKYISLKMQKKSETLESN